MSYGRRSDNTVESFENFLIYTRSMRQLIQRSRELTCQHKHTVTQLFCMGALSLGRVCVGHVHYVVDTFTGMYKQVTFAGRAGGARGVSCVGARGAHCRPSPEKQVSMQPPRAGAVMLPNIWSVNNPPPPPTRCALALPSSYLSGKICFVIPRLLSPLFTEIASVSVL